VVEFLDVIRPLTEPERGIAFHLVLPSISGFAFWTHQQGEWTTRRIARRSPT
jgi:hypothetical protein